MTPPSIRATVSEPADPPPLSGARTSGLDFGVVGEPAGPGVAPTTPRDEQTFPEATTERRPTLCSTPERQRRLQSGRGLRGLRSAGPLFSQLPFPSDVGGFPKFCALSKGARWQGVARTVARIREAHPLSRPPPSLGRAHVRRRRETCHFGVSFPGDAHFPRFWRAPFVLRSSGASRGARARVDASPSSPGGFPTETLSAPPGRDAAHCRLSRGRASADRVSARAAPFYWRARARSVQL